jgi:hypothetical protein
MNDYGLEDWQKDLVRKRWIRALEFWRRWTSRRWWLLLWRRWRWRW